MPETSFIEKWNQFEWLLGLPEPEARRSPFIREGLEKFSKSLFEARENRKKYGPAISRLLYCFVNCGNCRAFIEDRSEMERNHQCPFEGRVAAMHICDKFSPRWCWHPDSPAGSKPLFMRYGEVIRFLEDLLIEEKQTGGLLSQGVDDDMVS